MFTKCDILVIAWLATKLVVDAICFVYIILRIGNLK